MKLGRVLTEEEIKERRIIRDVKKRWFYAQLNIPMYGWSSFLQRRSKAGLLDANRAIFGEDWSQVEIIER